MSVYLEIDSDDGLPLASNTGWGDVLRYAQALPSGLADTLKHLTAYGWGQDIAILLVELPAAMKQVPPRPDIADTLTNLLTLLKTKPTAVVIAATNGMTGAADTDATTTAGAGTTKKTAFAKPAAKASAKPAGTMSVAQGGKDKSDTANALGKSGKVMGTPGSGRAAEQAEIRRAAIKTKNIDALEPHERELMSELLPACTTPEMVRAAFASLQKGVYLCRHAQTDASKLGNLRGWLDFPLNKQGKKDAAVVGEWLKGKSVEQVRRSDLKRAKQTSRRILDALGILQVYETGFWYRDWSLGLLDGRPQGDVDALIADYVTKNQNNAPDAGETFNKFLQRCLPRIQSLMDVVADPDQSGNVIALVTHSSVLRAVSAWMVAGAKIPTGDAAPFVIDAETFLTLPIADSSIVWLALTPQGWKSKLIDPLAGTADIMGTPR